MDNKNHKGRVNMRLAKGAAIETPRPTAEATHAEMSFLSCPVGHKLPHKTDRGECTPVHCPGWSGGVAKAREIKLRKRLVSVASTVADAEIDSLFPGRELSEARDAAKREKGEALARMSHAVGRMAARKAFFKVPENIEDPEAWAQKKAASMLPDALTELEYQLKLGDDSQRSSAVDRILDINGMRKREAVNGGGATIILNLGGKELPWAQRVVEKLNDESKKKPSE